MPSRRKIREAAVQFLYCADLEDGADPTDLSAPFWDFICESDQRKLLSAVYRTVLHLAQGREQRLEEWNRRQQAALQKLAAWPEAEELGLLLQRIAKSESKWTRLLEGLERISLDGDDETVVGRLQPALDEFFKVDRGVEESRNEFLSKLKDFPKLTSNLEAVAASTRRLQRISTRLRMVEDPEQFPEQADLAKLRESKSEIAQLRRDTQEIIARVIEHKPEIDAALADIIENYAPERIDPVDRAILRLASHELMRTDTPPKVILNEAVEIAKRYGTTDSSRFVNGVLDKIAARSSRS
ncbi:MAG: transcription antitermination factor NusB [Akkermansiaceae bacterium]|nr:transcription antitermination factor NusB [Akkermansiaceae bacterium]